jgi:hypothetical protein
MRRILRAHWSLGAALLLWLLLLGVLAHRMLASTGGRIVYGLDDAYIHMAVARHLVQEGVWGVTPYGFSASSSSVLWPLILAFLFRLFGVRETIPLLINVLLSVVLVILLYAWARPLAGSSLGTLALLAGFVLLIPLPTLVFNGMETLLQALLTFALSVCLIEHVQRPKGLDRVLLPVLAAGLASARYEGLFVIVMACALLLLRREYVLATTTGMAGGLPIAAFGLYSMSQGWSFLPNSLMVKHSPLVITDWSTLLAIVMRPFGTIADTFLQVLPRWAGLEVGGLFLGLMVLAWKPRWDLWNPATVAMSLFIGSALIHSVLISQEWFFRYGAYVVVMGLTALTYQVLALRSGEIKLSVGLTTTTLSGLFATITLGFALVAGSVQALLDTPLASRNIYDQQEQMALFLGQYYQGRPVAAIDIGVIDFSSDLRLVDLSGLASRVVAADKVQQQWNQSAITAVSDQGGTEIAVVHDSLLVSTGIPSSWIKVAEWTIPDNVVCGSDTVSWYGVGLENARTLAVNLQSFEPLLPRRVTVRSYSTPG